MNNAQRVIICVTIAAAVVAFLFPPWRFATGGADFWMGFSWILSPPQQRATAVDVGLLAIEEAIILGAGVGLYMLFGADRD